jgi:hypothetical protein
MKTPGGVDVYIHVFFFASALVGVASFTSRSLYHRGRIGGWVDPRAGLDDTDK